MNKKLPFKEQMKKVTGTAWYLPLPLEQTISKLCNQTDVLNTNHELYVLVRSVPKKDKKVWENLVDVKKVWNALTWLKRNNRFYEKINLPESADQLKEIINSLEQPEYQNFHVETDDMETINLMGEHKLSEAQKQVLQNKTENDSSKDSKQNDVIEDLSGSLSSISIDDDNESYKKKIST